MDKLNYKLSGVNKPCLYITGKCSNDLKLEIKEDNKSIKTTDEYDIYNNILSIRVVLNKTKSIIEIYENNKKIKTIYNNKCNRLFSKALDIILKVLKAAFFETAFFEFVLFFLMPMDLLLLGYGYLPKACQSSRTNVRRLYV